MSMVIFEVALATALVHGGLSPRGPDTRSPDRVTASSSPGPVQAQTGGGLLFRLAETSGAAASRVEFGIRLLPFPRGGDPIERTVRLGEGGKMDWLLTSSEIPDGRYRLNIEFSGFEGSYDLDVHLESGQPPIRIRVFRNQVALASPQAPAKSMPVAIAPVGRIDAWTVSPVDSAAIPREPSFSRPAASGQALPVPGASTHRPTGLQPATPFGIEIER
jgi:hypothetical protein